MKDFMKDLRSTVRSKLADGTLCKKCAEIAETCDFISGGDEEIEMDQEAHEKKQANQPS